MWNFTNKKALVTGASQGIGFAIARMLEKAGAEVHIFDLAENPQHGSPGIFHQLDISDPDQVREMVCKLPTDLSLLVNNAGITRDRSLIKMSDLEWRQVIDVNLSGAFHVIRALAPAMRELGTGHIVNITSIAETFFLPLSPNPLPQPGVGRLFSEVRYNLFVAVTALCVVLVTLIVEIGRASCRERV